MLRDRATDTTAQTLMDLPLWDGISPADAELVARHSDQVEVPAGASLCTAGRRASEVFLVLEGTAVVSEGGAPVAELGRGAIVGEMGQLDGGVRAADVDVLTHSRLLVFTAGSFRSLLDASPRLTRKVVAELSGRIRGAQLLGVGAAGADPGPHTSARSEKTVS